MLGIVKNIDLRCIILTYYVALLIDTDKEGEAKETSLEQSHHIEDSKYFGYFQNIIAALQSPTDAITTCIGALKIMETTSDHFGAGGTWGNIGVHMIKARLYDESIDSSKKAHEILSKFGIQHIHLVSNNLASSYLMIGELGQASMWLRRSLDLLQTSTIRINALQNLAALSYLRNQPETFEQAVTEGMRYADRQGIDRVRFKFLKNAYILCNNFDSSMKIVGENLRRYENPVNELDVSLAPWSIEDSSLRLKYLQENYDPPTNQYWYPNPMNLIPDKSLSVETYF